MSPDLNSEEIIKKVKLRMQRSQRPVVVNVSARHLHVTEEVFGKLFGAGKKLTIKRDLIQPGQYASAERVAIEGPRGRIENVTILGPFRKYTQVEISRTDSVRLGVDPPVTESGKLKGSSPIKIIGPEGAVDMAEGCIVAMRHLHLHPEDAAFYGIKDGDTVKILLSAGSERETVYRVLCRVRDDMKLECHLDTDEANAAGIKNGDTATIF